MILMFMFNIFGSQIPEISADEVKKAIDEKKEFALLDVRTPEEYKKTKITRSINLPVDEVTKKITSVMPDKDQTIYVYCFSGSRSSHAVSEMVKLGYKNTFSVTSGLLAWRAKKFPLE